MTTYIDHRAATDHRPVTDMGATTATSTASPKRPLPRWVAPVGIAAAVCVAGIGALIYDANNQPAPAPAASEASAISNGQVLRSGIPDGYFQLDNPVPFANATASESPVARTGQVPRPGQPDGGVTQPAGIAASTARVANRGCKISGPC